MSCLQLAATCQWKKSVIHLRLLNLPHESRRCENCVRKKGACQFIWEERPKRPAESDLEPESAAKRANIDSSDSLETISNNPSALVSSIVASLEGLHEKYSHN